jgi:hypothetical protein
MRTLYVSSLLCVLHGLPCNIFFLKVRCCYTRHCSINPKLPSGCTVLHFCSIAVLRNLSTCAAH